MLAKEITKKRPFIPLEKEEGEESLKMVLHFTQSPIITFKKYKDEYVNSLRKKTEDLLGRMKSQFSHVSIFKTAV